MGRLTIDILDELPLKENENRYILVVVNFFKNASLCQTQRRKPCLRFKINIEINILLRHILIKKSSVQFEYRLFYESVQVIRD